MNNRWLAVILAQCLLVILFSAAALSEDVLSPKTPAERLVFDSVR